MTEPSDDELMQRAYDNLGVAFPLRQPNDPKLLAVWKRAYVKVEEARAELEKPYKGA